MVQHHAYGVGDVDGEDGSHGELLEVVLWEEEMLILGADVDVAAVLAVLIPGESLVVNVVQVVFLLYHLHYQKNLRLCFKNC